MSAADRLSDDYEPRWDKDYEYGLQGELYVKNIVESLAAGSIEVKTDAKALQTGRIYVEYQCKRLGRYMDSGIKTTEAEFWAYVIGDDTVVIMPTWRLRQAVGSLYRRSDFFRKELVRGSHPTKGVVVPLSSLFDELFRSAS